MVRVLAGLVKTVNWAWVAGATKSSQPERAIHFVFIVVFIKGLEIVRQSLNGCQFSSSQRLKLMTRI